MTCRQFYCASVLCNFAGAGQDTNENVYGVSTEEALAGNWVSSARRQVWGHTSVFYRIASEGGSWDVCCSVLHSNQNAVNGCLCGAGTVSVQAMLSSLEKASFYDCTQHGFWIMCKRCSTPTPKSHLRPVEITSRKQEHSLIGSLSQISHSWRCLAWCTRHLNIFFRRGSHNPLHSTHIFEAWDLICICSSCTCVGRRLFESIWCSPVLLFLPDLKLTSVQLGVMRFNDRPQLQHKSYRIWGLCQYKLYLLTYLAKQLLTAALASCQRPSPPCAVWALPSPVERVHPNMPKCFYQCVWTIMCWVSRSIEDFPGCVCGLWWISWLCCIFPHPSWCIEDVFGSKPAMRGFLYQIRSIKCWNRWRMYLTSLRISTCIHAVHPPSRRDYCDMHSLGWWGLCRVIGPRLLNRFSDIWKKWDVHKNRHQREQHAQASIQSLEFWIP